MSTEKIKHLNDSNFEDVVTKSSIPVLVDFWAPWCGPCKVIAPIIDKVAEEYDGQILTCKVNVDESPEISAKYGVRGIPTIIIIKKGKVVQQHVGTVPKQKLDEMIASV